MRVFRVEVRIGIEVEMIHIKCGIVCRDRYVLESREQVACHIVLKIKVNIFRGRVVLQVGVGQGLVGYHHHPLHDVVVVRDV